MEKAKKLELKAGFYKMSGSQPYDISVADNDEVTIFDDTESDSLNFTLGKNSVLRFYGCYVGTPRKSIGIRQDCEGGQSDLNILNLVKDARSVIEIRSFLAGDSNASRINLLSVAGNDGDMKIDSGIYVAEKTKKCIADIRQDNVFVGDSAKISGIPGLYVHTDNVRASHSLKIEKIREADIFYLTSRGIDKTKATNIMLQSKVDTLFSGYPENKDFLLDIFDNFIKA